jgi:hypothetical protein
VYNAANDDWHTALPAAPSEANMTLLEKIQGELSQLPPEQQSEVLEFVTALRQKQSASTPQPGQSLRRHPAFGAWRSRGVDALAYQQRLRAEWGDQPDAGGNGSSG